MGSWPRPRRTDQIDEGRLSEINARFAVHEGQGAPVEADPRGGEKDTARIAQGHIAQGHAAVDRAVYARDVKTDPAAKRRAIERHHDEAMARRRIQSDAHDGGERDETGQDSREDRASAADSAPWRSFCRDASVGHGDGHQKVWPIEI
jgi:hypothetical protein